MSHASRLLPLALVLATTSAGEADAAQRFERLDQNHDGTVTRIEAGDDARFERILRRLDHNGDGALQRAELPATGRVDQPASAQAFPLPPEPPHTVHRDLAYADADAASVEPTLLSLDLYVPTGPSGGRPLLVMIHGGGWRTGDKSNANVVMAKMRHFVAAGYLFAAINYRLSSPAGGDVRHPVHVEDCAAALAWLHDHAAEFGGDPGRIHLMGHSAGGHLAGLVACDERYLAVHGKTLDIIQSNVLLDTAAIDIPLVMAATGEGGLGQLYRNAFGDNPDTWRTASPANHVAAGKAIPPTLVFYGGERMQLDQTAPAFAAALTAAGAPAQAIDVGHLDHGAINRHIGRVGEPMTALIMRLHAGQDPTGFPTSLAPTSGNGDTLFELVFSHPARIPQASAVVDAWDDGAPDLLIAGKRKVDVVRNHGAHEYAFDRRETVDNANGWGAHDFDRDGRLDAFVAQSAHGDAPDAWLARGDGWFEPHDLGNETLGNGRNVVFADFDGDGHSDAFHPVSSFQTNHHGCQLHPGTAEGFAPDIIDRILEPTRPGFWYATAEHPERGPERWSNKQFKGAVVRDFDRDGDPDIIVCAYADRGFQEGGRRGFGMQWVDQQERGLFLLDNRSAPGRIRFAEVAKEAFGPQAHGASASDWNVYAAIPLDWDRDGDFDLFVAAVLRPDGRGGHEDTRSVAFFENLSTPGRPRFRDRTEAVGFAALNRLPIAQRRHLNFASGAPVDIDNDGWVDLCLVNRRDIDATHAPWPHVFRNHNGGEFVEVPAPYHGLGIGGGGGRDLNYDDLDGDGRLDLIIHDGSGGGYDGADNTRIYANRDRSGHHWLQLAVVDPAGVFAFGARVEVLDPDRDRLLGLDEVRTDFCYRSKRYPVLHFGLANQQRIDVRVTTRNGVRQRFSSLAIDQRHRLVVGGE